MPYGLSGRRRSLALFPVDPDDASHSIQDGSALPTIRAAGESAFRWLQTWSRQETARGLPKAAVGVGGQNEP